MFVGLLNNSKIITNGMDKCFLRNQILSTNIANTETPEFKAKDLFINVLNPLTSKGEISYLIEERSDVSPKENGNTVDMAKEMTSLVENVLEYNALVQAMSKNISHIEYALGDRR